MGVGDVIALADVMIVNEGSLAALKDDAEEKLRRWLRDEG